MRDHYRHAAERNSDARLTMKEHAGKDPAPLAAELAEFNATKMVQSNCVQRPHDCGLGARPINDEPKYLELCALPRFSFAGVIRRQDALRALRAGRASTCNPCMYNHANIAHALRPCNSAALNGHEEIVPIPLQHSWAWGE